MGNSNFQFEFRSVNSKLTDKWTKLARYHLLLFFFQRAACGNDYLGIIAREQLVGITGLVLLSKQAYNGNDDESAYHSHNARVERISEYKSKEALSDREYLHRDKKLS